MADSKKPPEESAVQGLVGEVYSRFTTFTDELDRERGPLVLDWKYYKPTGWFKNGFIKKKRLFLFIPREGGFIFRMVFNEKAIAMMKDRDFPDFVTQGLDAAKKYPEGKPFDLDEESFDPKLATKLVEIKLQSTK